MTFISYAQNFEDVILWRALNFVSNGFYIDIGAHHPVNDSVSLAFYKNNWRGVHVEPTTYYSDLLRKFRPDEVVIQAAVSEGCKDLDFYEFRNTGLSTTNRDIANQHIDSGFKVFKTNVPVISLNDLLERFNNIEIQWLKIDVEGGEAAVLRSWGESRVKPWVICIESTEPRTSRSTHREWEDIVISKGYIFKYFDGLNRFYISDDHLDIAEKISAPVSTLDDYLVSLPIIKYFRLSVDRMCRQSTVINFLITKIKFFINWWR